MNQKILFAFSPPNYVLAAAKKEFTVVECTGNSQKLLETALAEKPGAIFVAMGQGFSEAEISALPDSVKIVATFSVGYDHLNVPAFSVRGIAVTNTPDVLNAATADLTMLLLLGAARRLGEHRDFVRAGWGKPLGLTENLGLDLCDKKLAILGMGRIGQAVAVRARSFGMNLIYCNRHRLAPELEFGAQYFEDFEKMLPQAQFLSLHAPGTAQTESVMNSKTFKMLPEGSVFINVARGSLVDETALLDSLDSNHLFAAALDVCRNEPNPDPRLLAHKKILLTPHIGSATRETRDEMGFRGLENIRSVLRGEVPRDQLN